jgi:hypothetical protein
MKVMILVESIDNKKIFAALYYAAFHFIDTNVPQYLEG